MGKRKQQKWRTSKDPADRLIVAADNWLKSRGGDGIVAGPICIVSEPYESEQKFIIGVKIFGKRPPKVEESEKILSERANAPLLPDTEYLMKYLADQYGNLALDSSTYEQCSKYLHGYSDGKADNGQLEVIWKLLSDAATILALLRRFESK